MNHISIPIQTEKFLKLIHVLENNGDPRNPTALLDDLIDGILEGRGYPYKSSFSGNTLGYQWWDIHCPHGTEMRTRYRGQPYIAKVKGNDLFFNGQSVTPSRFANMVSNSSRNAWKTVWIKRPGDRTWILADRLRQTAKK